jgi:hypothetical protein
MGLIGDQWWSFLKRRPKYTYRACNQSRWRFD